jgi:hypothetical protein
VAADIALMVLKRGNKNLMSLFFEKVVDKIKIKIWKPSTSKKFALCVKKFLNVKWVILLNVNALIFILNGKKETGLSKNTNMIVCVLNA